MCFFQHGVYICRSSFQVAYNPHNLHQWDRAACMHPERQNTGHQKSSNLIKMFIKIFSSSDLHSYILWRVDRKLIMFREILIWKSTWNNKSERGNNMILKSEGDLPSPTIRSENHSLACQWNCWQPVAHPECCFHFSLCDWQVDHFVSHSITNSIPVKRLRSYHRKPPSFLCVCTCWHGCLWWGSRR